MRGAWAVLFLAALSLCPAVVGQSAPAQQQDWWDPQWSCRLTVRVPDPGRRAGINTALLNLAEQSRLCRPDGSDVRVLAPDGRLLPHRTGLKDNQTLDVLFEVPRDASAFSVYYGNLNAEKAEEQWRESLGGLFLETRPIEDQLKQPRDLQAAVQQVKTVFGRQPWGRIWDTRNPFGRDDMYLSVYEGTLYCPEAGQYVFAVNGDDIITFSIEGVGNNPLCWRGPGSPSESWDDPGNPRALRRVRMEKGVYRITCHHGENYGAQLAQLGWRTPSSDSIVTVPTEAFVHYLPAEVEALEVLGRDLSPFFAVQHRYNLRVNGHEPGFPSFRFAALLPQSQSAEGRQFLWDFGDGCRAEGAVVVHEFTDARQHDVKLNVRSVGGEEASVTRPVGSPAEPVRDMSVRLYVEPAGRVIGSGAPLRLHCSVAAEGPADRPFLLATKAAWPAQFSPRETAERPLEFAHGEPEGAAQWAELLMEYAPAEGDMSLSFGVTLHGVEVATQQLAVRNTAGLLAGLHTDNAQCLRDDGGALVVLRLTEMSRDRAPERRISDLQEGSVNVLVFDDLLGGPPGGPDGGGFVGSLQSMLTARYADLSFSIKRVAAFSGTGVSPLERLLQLSRALGRDAPTLVMLVCQTQDVVDGLPLDDFERCLSACVDQVLARSRAELVIVTPVPLPGMPEAARPYALAAKRVGLRKGVPVVDLYTRFRLTGGWEELFLLGQDAGPCYLLYPNERGQEVVAAELYAAMLDSFHGDFSAAVRQAALMGGGRSARRGR
jgi:hypothetical protein